MAYIELAPEVGDDFDRILEQLAEHQVEQPALRIREIIEALNVLELNPSIGRSTTNDLRELVIGQKAHGYLALYRHVEGIATIFVLAVRGQREAGYSGT